MVLRGVAYSVDCSTGYNYTVDRSTGYLNRTGRREPGSGDFPIARSLWGSLWEISRIDCGSYCNSRLAYHTDRAADNWRPLLAIADAAGKDWPQRARDACKAMSGAAAEEGEQESSRRDAGTEAPGAATLAGDTQEL